MVRRTPSALKSAGALLAGMVLSVVLSIAADVVAGAAGLNPLSETSAQQDWRYLLPLSYRCAIDVLPWRSISQGEVRSTPVMHAAGRVGGPAMLMRSADGGDTWTVADLRAQAGMILDVKFQDPQVGFLCAGTSEDLERSNAAILRTADGGASWRTVYRSSRPLELCWKMSFPSTHVGYATVQNNNNEVEEQIILKTTDGGLSWRELPFDRAPGLREFGVGFVDEQLGWVGTPATGYETRNGGRTWREIDIGQSVNKIRIIRQGRRFTAYAIGQGVARLDGELP